MLCTTFSSSPFALSGRLVRIEACLEKAVPQFSIIGLPNNVIKESRDRIRACLNQLGFEFPSSRLTVHLSPAEEKKSGSQLDLAIAIAALGSERCLQGNSPHRIGFLGELSLDGSLRAVHSATALLESLAAEKEIDFIVAPRANAREAALIGSSKILLMEHISETLDWILGRMDSKGFQSSSFHEFEYKAQSQSAPFLFEDVLGQTLAKRALEVSVAGGHHILLCGPPGVGKSVLVQAAASLLPELDATERIAVAKASEHVDRKLRVERPFRAPHHSVSAAAFLGGGSGVVLPGEVSLAHRGVLFLDELPEFRRECIEGLREPIESGSILINRVGHSAQLPADFILMSTMNPCPCGYLGSEKLKCVCSRSAIESYRKKISGPILDRIDIHVLLSRPAPQKQSSSKPETQMARERIERAVDLQNQRWGKGIRNARVAFPILEKKLQITARSWDWCAAKMESASVSIRRIHKSLRVACTLADLDGSQMLEEVHLEEAWRYRFGYGEQVVSGAWTSFW